MRAQYYDLYALPNTMGVRLMVLRQQRGLTQEELAGELNTRYATAICKSTISKWELDGGLPSVSNLALLARYFGVSMDYIVNGKENE